MFKILTVGVNDVLSCVQYLQRPLGQEPVAGPTSSTVTALSSSVKGGKRSSVSGSLSLFIIDPFVMNTALDMSQLSAGSGDIKSLGHSLIPITRWSQFRVLDLLSMVTTVFPSSAVFVCTLSIGRFRQYTPPNTAHNLKI